MKEQESHGAALPLGTQLGDYQIESILGQGEFGIVYSAIDAKLNRAVAIKEHFPRSLCYRDAETAELYPLHENSGLAYEHSLNYFCKEARIIAQLDHPSIVQVHDIFQACGTAYIVMSLVQGVHLEDWLQENAQQPQKVTQMLRRLLGAFSYMHGQAVLHRDIKLTNIVITDEGQLPILIDFGAALEGLPQGTMTMIGSPAFSAPEQFEKHGKVGPWSDLYALGRSFQHALGPALASYPRAFRQSLNKATQTLLEHRYASAQQWLDELQERRYKRLILGLVFVGAIGGSLYIFYPKPMQEEGSSASVSPSAPVTPKEAVKPVQVVQPAQPTQTLQPFQLVEPVPSFQVVSPEEERQRLVEEAARKKELRAQQQKASVAALLEQRARFSTSRISEPNWPWKNKKLFPSHLTGCSFLLGESLLLHAPLVNQALVIIDDNTCELAGKRYSYTAENLTSTNPLLPLYLKALDGKDEDMELHFVFFSPEDGVAYQIFKDGREQQSYLFSFRVAL